MASRRNTVLHTEPLIRFLLFLTAPFAGNGLVREGGLEVIASEYSKRTLLVSCLVSNLSTRDIFNFSDAIYQENKVVQLFQKAYFESVTIAFERSKISNI